MLVKLLGENAAGFLACNITELIMSLDASELHLELQAKLYYKRVTL